MHTTSKTPLRQILLVSADGIYGTAKMAINITEHIQKAPLILMGLNVRAISIPAVKGKSILRSPPRKFMLSNVQPTLRHPLPVGSVMVNAPSAIPSTVHNTAKALSGSRRISRA